MFKQESISCQIAPIGYDELLAFMRQQAEDTFPSLKDEERLLTFTHKIHSFADLCLCRDNDKLVGIIAFYANGKGADFAYIPHVYISPNYRGKGLFSMMFSIVEDYVRTKGFTEIRLEVDNNNYGAKSAYLRNGFVQGNIASPCSVYMVKPLIVLLNGGPRYK